MLIPIANPVYINGTTSILERDVAVKAPLALQWLSPEGSSPWHQAALPSSQPHPSSTITYSKASNVLCSLSDRPCCILSKRYPKIKQKFTVLHQTTQLIHWGWNGNSAVKCGREKKLLKGSTFRNTIRKEADRLTSAAKHLYTDRKQGIAAMTQRLKKKKSPPRIYVSLTWKINKKKKNKVVASFIWVFWSNVQLYERNTTASSERVKIIAVSSKMKGLMVGDCNVLMFLALGPVTQ